MSFGAGDEDCLPPFEGSLPPPPLSSDIGYDDLLAYLNHRHQPPPPAPQHVAVVQEGTTKNKKRKWDGSESSEDDVSAAKQHQVIDTSGVAAARKDAADDVDDDDGDVDDDDEGSKADGDDGDGKGSNSTSPSGERGRADKRPSEKQEQPAKRRKGQDNEARRRQAMAASFKALAETVGAPDLSRRNLLVHVTDIVKKMDAENQQLRERVENLELRLRQHGDMHMRPEHTQVFLGASVPMDIVTGTGKFVDCNEKFAEFIGYSREELTQDETFFGITHPDSMADTFRYVHAIMTSPSGTLHSMVKKYVRKDGEVIRARVTCFSTKDSEGRTEYITAMLEPEPPAECGETGSDSAQEQQDDREEKEDVGTPTNT